MRALKETHRRCEGLRSRWEGGGSSACRGAWLEPAAAGAWRPPWGLQPEGLGDREVAAVAGLEPQAGAGAESGGDSQ